MTITEVLHENVAKDGKCESGGAVETDPVLRLSPGGCSLEGCHCSDHPFLFISGGRDSYGKVRGFQIQFDSLKEMNSILGNQGARSARTHYAVPQ